jgi:hypothetical protein
VETGDAVRLRVGLSRRIDGDKLERVEVTGRIHVGAWVVQDEIAGANVGQKAGESGDRLVPMRKRHTTKRPLEAQRSS